MAFTDKQRIALIEKRGQPKLSLEFDVFDGGNVSMWTHFNHSSDYGEMKNCLTLIRAHLDEFLKDEEMCPFHKTTTKTMGEITFEDLVQHGRDNGANIVNGMPWSFNFSHFHISHERDDCYIVGWHDGSLHIHPGETLSVGVDGVVKIIKT